MKNPQNTENMFRIMQGQYSQVGVAISNSPDIIGDAKLYVFSSDDQHFLGDAQPFILPPSTSIKDALDSLGRHTAKNYFSKTYSNKPADIHFELVKIDEISTPSRPLRIAVINMVDAHKDAMTSFFQGAVGGQTTFCILAATFMQPHLAPPLLDGLTILYNGKMLPELDHTNLTGILIPKLARYVVKRAIHGTKRQPVSSNQEWVKMRKLKL